MYNKSTKVMQLLIQTAGKIYMNYIIAKNKKKSEIKITMCANYCFRLCELILLRGIVAYLCKLNKHSSTFIASHKVAIDWYTSL